MKVGEFVIPPLLDDLLRQGKWPTTIGESYESWVNEDLVRAIAPGQSEICFSKPPFRTLADEVNDWLNRFHDPKEIDYPSAVIIGDFGPGSDSPIVLDYRDRRHPPKVVALSLIGHPNPNPGQGTWPDNAAYALDGHWVVLADTFEEFAHKVRLRG